MPRIPRITTRGFYDLETGKTLSKKSYRLYPKKFFEHLHTDELTIMIHGLRNNRSGALAKFAIAKKRLRSLGYKYPLVGFSYDSDVRGAHIKSCEVSAIKVGKLIAKKNGANLAKFIIDFKKKNPATKIRLMGHSLGTEVIMSALLRLKPEMIECVYFFGSSIPSNQLSGNLAKMQKTVRNKIINYYGRNDDVLRYADRRGLVTNPVGLCGISSRTASKYTQRHVMPKNHRFASYAQVLGSFP